MIVRDEQYNSYVDVRVKQSYGWAKNASKQKFCEELDWEDEKRNVIRAAKQLVEKNRDVKDIYGKIMV